MPSNEGYFLIGMFYLDNKSTEKVNPTGWNKLGSHSARSLDRDHMMN